MLEKVRRDGSRPQRRRCARPPAISHLLVSHTRWQGVATEARESASSNCASEIVSRGCCRGYAVHVELNDVSGIRPPASRTSVPSRPAHSRLSEALRSTVRRQAEARIWRTNSRHWISWRFVSVIRRAASLRASWREVISE